MKENQAFKIIRIILAILLLGIMLTGMLGLFPKSIYQRKIIVDRTDDKLISIQAKENSFNFFMLTNNIAANTDYLLTFGQFTLTEGESEIAVAALLDVATQNIIAQKIIPIHDEAEKAWYFTAPENEQGLELLVYPYLRGETEWIGLDIEGVSLTKDIQNPYTIAGNLLSSQLAEGLYLPSNRDADHHEVIEAPLTSKNTYTLSIGQATVLKGNPEGLSIALYDEDTGEVLDSTLIDISSGFVQNAVWTFTVPDGSNNVSLRLYTGKAGESHGISMLFEHLALTRAEQ